MKRVIFEFNDKGVSVFAEMIEAERAKVKSSQPAKIDLQFLSKVEDLTSTPELCQSFSTGIEIDDELQFSTRYEFGQYLNEVLPKQLSAVGYDKVGLWSWISAVYLKQLTKPSSRGSTHDLWSSYRYIPVSYSKFRYYRHLAFISFWVHRQLGENAAKLFLSRPLYEHSDAVEQLYTSDKDFLTTPALLEVSVEMYIDPTTGVMKRNALGAKTPGSARRLATIVAKQLQMNFDLVSMDKEQIYQLLPKEFDAWQVPAPFQ